MCIGGECRAFNHESNIMSGCANGDWKCIASEEQQDKCNEGEFLCNNGCCSCGSFRFNEDE